MNTRGVEKSTPLVFKHLPKQVWSFSSASDRSECLSDWDRLVRWSLTVPPIERQAGCEAKDRKTSETVTAPQELRHPRWDSCLSGVSEFSRFDLFQIDELGGFDSGVLANLDKFRGLEEGPGVVERCPHREVDDSVGIALGLQNLVRPLARLAANPSCAVEDLLPCGVVCDFMNDQDMRHGVCPCEGELAGQSYRSMRERPLRGDVGIEA